MRSRVHLNRTGSTATAAATLALVAGPLGLVGTTAAASSGPAPHGVQPACNNLAPARQTTPDWAQSAELGGLAPGHGLGESAAVSSDGTVALVGSSGVGGNVGYAAVFTNVGGTWDAGARLKGGDTETGDGFGSSVALSADGAMAVVGAPSHGAGAGTAYVFADDAGTWSQVAELTAPDGSGNVNFGTSVAISGAGDTVLVGAPEPGSGERFGPHGAFYTFSAATGWQQSADVVNNGGFGQAVAISGDGLTALVGAPTHTEGGVAFMYTWNGTAWHRSGRVARHRKCSFDDHFGDAVALSADGTVALIGEPDHNGHGYAGAIHEFRLQGTVWKETGTVFGTSVRGKFGASVALSADGSLALAGAPGAGTGAAFVYDDVTKHATPVATLTAGDGVAGDALGTSVALSADGSTAFVGAPRHTTRGALYVFDAAAR